MGKYSDKLTKEQKLEMLRLMEVSRHFDLELSKLYSRGLVAGMTHYSVGEEAANIGGVFAMKLEDIMYSNHRGHAQTISKGIDTKLMMAEILGREPGYCKGRGGSMHVFNLEVNNMGCNGIVGGGQGLSIGAAFVQKRKNTGNIVVSFMGDGATNEGSFHETLNMASIWDLPVIFYVINNKYGISMDINNAMNVENVVDRAPAYNVKAIHIKDGNDVLAVYDGAMEAIEHARAGKGPVLFETNTYRWFGHSASDAGAYRSREEVNAWREKDPIEAFRKVLLDSKTANVDELDAIREEAVEEIKEAVEFAKNAPFPDESVAFQDNYAD